jgi:hypothetical protein
MPVIVPYSEAEGQTTRVSPVRLLGALAAAVQHGADKFAKHHVRLHSERRKQLKRFGNEDRTVRIPNRAVAY